MASKQNLSKAAQARVKNYSAKSNAVENNTKQRKRDNRLALIAGLASLGIALGSQFLYANMTSTAFSRPTALPTSTIAENRDWTGSMTVNSTALELTLHGALAPQGVSNFVALANSKFYDGLTCHRVTTAGIYVLQCGDPVGDGTGGPGYSWGPIENAPKGDIYPAGTIAMARQSNNASSMGSQFFIVYKDSTIPSDSVGGYSVIGNISSGLAAVELIAGEGTLEGGTDGHPKNPVTLSNVHVK